MAVCEPIIDIFVASKRYSCHVVGFVKVFINFVARNFDSSREMRLPTHRFLESIEPLFAFMSGSFQYFYYLKMCFWKGHERLESKVYCFRCVTLRILYCLIILSLRFPQTLGLSFRGYLWKHVLNFGGLKMRFLADREKISSNVHDVLSKHFFAFWQHNIRPDIVQPGLWTRSLAFRRYSEKGSRKACGNVEI